MPNTTRNISAPAQDELPTVLQQMSDPINAHNVDAITSGRHANASCFTNDYKGEQPLHPEIAVILQRRGSANGLVQVRENWTGLFAQVPDLRATLVAATIHDDLAWAEWHWQGTRTSESALNLRGVSVAGLRNGIMAWARIYMEPIHDRSSTG
jgi:SnoaL-like domain